MMAPCNSRHHTHTYASIGSKEEETNGKNNERRLNSPKIREGDTCYQHQFRKTARLYVSMMSATLYGVIGALGVTRRQTVRRRNRCRRRCSKHPGGITCIAGLSGLRNRGPGSRQVGGGSSLGLVGGVGDIAGPWRPTPTEARARQFWLRRRNDVV